MRSKLDFSPNCYLARGDLGEVYGWDDRGRWRPTTILILRVVHLSAGEIRVDYLVEVGQVFKNRLSHCVNIVSSEGEVLRDQ